MCRNNIVRLWVETPQSERFQFTVCSVIEPGPAGTVVDFLNHAPEVTTPVDSGTEVPTISAGHSSKPKISRHSKTLSSTVSVYHG